VREEVVVEESRYTYEIIHSDEGAILHFWLHTFYDDENHSSAKDFKKIYDEARKQKKLIGVVLDLRENSGGLMSQAVEMCGQFIHRGVVATVIDRYQGKIHLRNMHSPPICKLPVVTLIDRASASSSEIVAQCLKDYGRAIILGDGSSFGKGSYQSLSISDPEKIDPRGEYRLTKGLYYTVSGISPQLNGVTPDVCVPGPLDKLEIGERYTKYALENKSIENNYIDRMEDVNPLWQVRAKKITAHQQNRIPDATIKHLNQASKERLSKVKKKEGISYEEEKQLVLDEAVEVLKHWCKFHESHLRY
jgi:carboxyl-terminal processing protease